jgi:uncharacterized coiled-coil protein SlyX
MGTTTPRRVMPTDWKAQLQAANRRIAELEGKISVQNERLQQLSGVGAGTQAVTRMLDVLKQNLERTTIYKQFIETRLDQTPDAASDSGQLA